MLSTRTAASLLAVLAVVTATACSDAGDPLGLAPSAPLAAKGKVGPTHPVGTLSQRVSLAALPWGIAVSSTGVVLAVLPGTNTVGGFPLSDPTALRAQVPVGGRPLDIVFNHKGTLAYVSSGNTGYIDVIDVKSNTVKDSIAIAPNVDRLELSQNETRIYATTLDGALWTAPLKGGKKQKASIDLISFWTANGSALSPSGSDLYVSSTNGSIWRLDPETLEIRQSITLPATIQDIAVTPDGSALWAADERGTVLRLDPTTLAVTATITPSFYSAPFGLAISPDGARVYAASALTGTLHIISETAPNTFDVTSLAVGGGPRRIAFSEDGATAVVSNQADWVDIIR